MKQQNEKNMGKVKMKTFIGVSMFIFGVLILFMSVIINEVTINTATGTFLTLFSLMYIINPVLTYDSNGFKKKNLLGMTLKNYSFAKDEVAVRNDTVFVNGKKMMIGRSMLIKSEYKKFLNHLIQNSNEDYVSRGKTNEELLDSDL